MSNNISLEAVRLKDKMNQELDILLALVMGVQGEMTNGTYVNALTFQSHRVIDTMQIVTAFIDVCIQKENTAV